MSWGAKGTNTCAFAGVQAESAAADAAAEVARLTAELQQQQRQHQEQQAEQVGRVGDSGWHDRMTA